MTHFLQANQVLHDFSGIVKRLHRLSDGERRRMLSSARQRRLERLSKLSHIGTLIVMSYSGFADPALRSMCSL